MKLSFNFLKILIPIIFLASLSVFAQAKSSKSENPIIDEMTDKLDKKLILSDNQISDVRKILQEYFDKVQKIDGNGKEADKLQNAADDKIQGIFDKKQKMKFSIISEDWWALAKE